MRIGIADYGLNVWDGGGCFDLQERLLRLKQLGYEGIERLTVMSGEHAMQSAFDFIRFGADFASWEAVTLVLITAVLRAAIQGGFDGWVSVEQDTHPQDPYIDLAASRKCLQEAGY
jgi:hypothetical protein